MNIPLIVITGFVCFVLLFPLIAYIFYAVEVLSYKFGNKVDDTANLDDQGGRAAFTVRGACHNGITTKGKIMPNMKLIPTRAGLVYECVECETRFDALSTIPPDHECMTVFSFQCQTLLLE